MKPKVINCIYMLNACLVSYKRNLILILFFSFSISCINSQKEVRPIDVEFVNQSKILFPCQPEIDSSDYKYYRSIKLECNHGDDFYSFQAVEYQNGLYSSDSIDRIDYDLDYSQTDFLQKGTVKIWNAFPKINKGFPGKEFRYEYLREDKIRFTRVYIVKNVLFQLIYEGVKIDAYKFKIDDFFDSFELVDVQDNDPPYFYMPAEDEISEEPVRVAFPSEPKSRMEVHENFIGKIPVFMKMSQNDDLLKDSYLVVATSYSPLPRSIDSVDIKQIINDTRNLLKNGQVNSKIISESLIANGYEFQSEYRLAGELVDDVRRLYFFDDKYFIIITIERKLGSRSEIVKDFLESAELKY